ncbi:MULTISPECIES: PspC domain-containing protein [unclassified Halanaerobium]|uniref:PspC domain-containing protein n=1 Tax=unclassified Halanaerobium TaxID=2641197 RepID=UPI000DF41F06|nr:MULTISPECIES: PspC domain-containing protein [unclassified Halanaerobium]RCW49958.1 phage shock protein C (PspC) family protein [Halanaerobium sp. MA284_MarDTE_T2]RCW81099.1 phage shock protein C (PspC) family protein [Halanaerobium sp. DL-01]
MKKRIYRSRDDRIIAGICGGLAEYFNIDATLIRLAFIFIFIFQGIGLIAYLISWFIIPEKPEEKEQKEQYYLPTQDNNIKNGAEKEDDFYSNYYQSDELENDKYQADKQFNKDHQIEDHRSYDSKFENNNVSNERNKTLGLILIIIGAIFLVNIWIPEFYWQKYWPVFLIAAGLLILFRGVKNNDS